MVATWPDVSLYVDGVFGYKTKVGFQRFLRREGYYSGNIDGDFGHMSRSSFQRWLRGKGIGGGRYTGNIDGWIGEMTLFAAADFHSYGGSVYTRNISFYNSWSYPNTWPDYNLTAAIQRLLNHN